MLLADLIIDLPPPPPPPVTDLSAILAVTAVVLAGVLVARKYFRPRRTFKSVVQEIVEGVADGTVTVPGVEPPAPGRTGCYCVELDCLRSIAPEDLDGFLADGLCPRCRSRGREGVRL